VGRGKENKYLSFRGKVLELYPAEKCQIPTGTRGKKKKALQENPRIEFPLTAHKEALLPIDLLLLISQ